MSPKAILILALFFLLAPSGFSSAHDNPTELPLPKSEAEAWNVIEQCKANIDQMLSANLMRDVAGQLANIATGLRPFDGDKHGDASNCCTKAGYQPML